MKIEVSVPEVVHIFKEINEKPDRIFEMIRIDIREQIGHYLTALMEAELTDYLGRKPYERGALKSNHRNGSYDRNFTLKGIGPVDVKVPRDRRGGFRTRVIPRGQRYEGDLKQDLCLLFLTGISTRNLSMISKKLIGRRLSAGEVSKANQELTKAAEAWRTRDLSPEAFKYLFLDGVCFDMRIRKKIQSVPVLVAIGIKESGHKLVLSLQAGDKESASNWREFFKDLKSRGLNSEKVILGIMDGLPGLEKVFKEEFIHAKTQRCQVHVARNVLAKVPKTLKTAVADDLRSIFYASSLKKAKELFSSFRTKWEKDLSSAVACLGQSIDACLTFFSFPEAEWTSLRTTNIIERLNKEFKRRTKPMEIVAGEQACYSLLAFICIKMELQWRSNPIGKVRNNLPFFKKDLALDNFRLGHMSGRLKSKFSFRFAPPWGHTL
jgi:putative transposase